MTLPTSWYNLPGDDSSYRIAPLDPKTGREFTAKDYRAIFPEPLAEQECDPRNAFVPIPKDVLARYALWRPTPLLRARALEERLKTKCRLYYKYEGGSPVGSHKPNTAIAQAFYTKQCGYKGVVTETGAGQVGSAVSMAASFYGLRGQVFMVRNSFETKPGRRTLMKSFGAEVTSSPSTLTRFGSSVLKSNPEFAGSLGVAIAEAIEFASERKDHAYNIGSALNLVCLHQSIIGEELVLQLKEQGVKPDYVACCIGGGSGFAGMVFPLYRELHGKKTQFIAVESNAVPRVSRGVYGYDYGDTGKMTPLSKMYTLGSTYAPPGIHAGGLRYHGLSPLVSKFIHDGHASIRSYSQLETFSAALEFTRCEGIMPAPEASHSIRAAIDLAQENKDHDMAIVFCVTGHGYFDLAGYERFISGGLEDSMVPEAEIRRSLGELAKQDAALTPGCTPEPEHRSAPGSRFDRWWGEHFERGGQGARSPTAVATREPTAPSAPAHPTSRKSVDYSAFQVLSESLVEQAREAGASSIDVGPRCVITPLASERALDHRISVVRRRP